MRPIFRVWPVPSHFPQDISEEHCKAILDGIVSVCNQFPRLKVHSRGDVLVEMPTDIRRLGTGLEVVVQFWIPNSEEESLMDLARAIHTKMKEVFRKMVYDPKITVVPNKMYWQIGG